MASKILISVPEEFLREIDEVARSEHRSRSELLREAARVYLEQRAKPARPIDDPEIRSAYEGILAGSLPGAWDSVAVIRKMRETRYGSRK